VLVKTLNKLSEDFSEAIHEVIETHYRSGSYGGWVHSSSYENISSQIAFAREVSNNPFFKRYAKRFSFFDKLSQRTEIQSDLKESIAKYFWEQYMPEIERKKIDSIYFESGSSIAYLSNQFLQYLKEEEWFYDSNLHKNIRIRTNNLLSYFDFRLADSSWKPINVSLMPYGAFSRDYGGTYGDLKKAVKQPPPADENEDYILLDGTIKIAEELTKDLGLQFNKSGIILMTASGVDIRKNFKFNGPHVGSFYNMLLKRCLLKLPCPKIMFLDESKWNYNFIFDNCHPIYDPGSWDKLKRETPLAIALSCSSKDKRNKISSSIAENGFEHQQCSELKPGLKGSWSIIAGNEMFKNYFRK